MSVFSIGAGALQAAYLQLQTTGHNIANASTPGYSRQEVTMQTAPSYFSGSGFVGRGVQVAGIERRYDAFVTAEVQSSVAAQSQDAARAEQLALVDRLFSDSESGVASAARDFASSLADLAIRPADLSSRAAVLTRADTLAARMRATDAQLAEVERDTDDRIRQTVTGLNATLEQLARLNDRIAVAGRSATPNDMLDQRDQLIEQVNESMKATAYINDDGTVNLYAAAGHALVVGNTAAQLGVQSDPLRAELANLTLKTGGQDIPVDAASLQGGSLAGLLEARDEDLQAVRTQLGAYAAGLADAYNTAQSLGVDANGASGKPLFELKGSVRLAEGSSTAQFDLRVKAGEGASVRPTDYELSFDGTGWSAKRLADGSTASVSSGAGGAPPLSFDGLELTLQAGTVTAGSTFSVRGASEFGASMRALSRTPADLATGQALMPTAGADNGGDLQVSAFAMTAPRDTASLPAVPWTLRFDGAGGYGVFAGTDTTATPVATGTYVPGQAIAHDDWSITLVGTPKAGDTLQLARNASPGTDNRGARELAAVSDRAITGRIDGQAARPDDAWGTLVGDVGLRAQSAQAASDMSQRLLENARDTRSQVSGVDLDEEAARLMEFQQAYQAAAKLIQTAQSMFQTLFESMR